MQESIHKILSIMWLLWIRAKLITCNKMAHKTIKGETRSNQSDRHLVCLKVFLDVRLLCKCSPADNALIRFFASVWTSMLLEVKVLRERFVAVLAAQQPRCCRCAACLRYRRLHVSLWLANGITVRHHRCGFTTTCCWQYNTSVDYLICTQGSQDG